MANRRMFSKEIVMSDLFLDMPGDTKLLYFYLGMEADDDGFVSPKKVMRIAGISDIDNLKILISKEFLIPFDDGVVVVTHWKENNYIQIDRKKQSMYQNNLLKLQCIQNVYKLDTQDRIGEDRLGKDNIYTNADGVVGNEINNLLSMFKELNPNYERLYPRQNQRDALKRMIDKFGQEKIVNMINAAISSRGKPYAPTITTPVQLEDKLGMLANFINKNKSKKGINYDE